MDFIFLFCVLFISIIISFGSCSSNKAEETTVPSINPYTDISFYGFMKSKSNCSNGVEYTFYGYSIDYMLVKVTLRKPSDTECVTKPYGQLEGYYDLSSPGINANVNWMIKLVLVNLTFVPLTNESYRFRHFCGGEFPVHHDMINVMTECKNFKYREVFVLPKYYCHEVLKNKQSVNDIKLYYFCKDNEEGYKWNKKTEGPPLFISENVILFDEEPKLATDEEVENCELQMIAIYIFGFVLTVSILAVIVRYFRTRKKKSDKDNLPIVDLSDSI